MMTGWPCGLRGIGERPARLDPAALVVRVVHLRRIGEHARLLVEHEGVLVPAVPQREAGLEHLVGAVVAQLARRQLVEAGVLGLEIGRRGHDVPGHAALAHDVERGEPARQVIGRVEAGRERGAEAEMARRRRHHRQHHGRIEEADLPAAPQIGVVAAVVDVVEAEQVGEEAAVELRRLRAAARCTRSGWARGCRRASTSGCRQPPVCCAVGPVFR